MTATRESATLDTMFDLIDGMNVPEGYRAEIIEGAIVLNPRCKAHSTIVRLLTRSVEDAAGRDANILWDVRIDFPGVLNGYAPDVALVARDAEELENGSHRYEDVELVAEIVSRRSRRDDVHRDQRRHVAMAHRLEAAGAVRGAGARGGGAAVRRGRDEHGAQPPAGGAAAPDHRSLAGPVAGHLRVRTYGLAWGRLGGVGRGHE